MLLSEMGPALRELREKQRMTQADVAEKAGLTGGSLSRIETGEAVPSLRVVEGILAILGVEFDDLVFMARRLTVERVRENLEREPPDGAASRIHREASLCLAEGVLNLAQFLNLAARLELQMGQRTEQGGGEDGDGAEE